MRSSVTVFLSFCLLFILTTANAITSKSSPTIGTMHALTVGDITDMSAKEFSKYTGEKLTFKDRVVYSLVKSKIKKELKRGEIQRHDSFDRAAAAGSFNFGAFLLGLFLGLIGLIIVLLAFDDKDAWKEALIGMGVALIFFGAVLLA